MKRKVIKLAEQTLVVSLPAQWCKANGIRKGDDVLCDERRGSMVISRDLPSKKTSAKLDGDAFGILVKRALNELYHAGVDKVTIQAKQPKTVKHINDTLNQLLGYHIVAQEKGSVVVEDLGRADQDLDALFRRFLLLIKTMLDDGINAAQKKDADALRSIVQRDIDVNKFANLCIRTLSKDPHLAPDHAARMHTLIYHAEQLADEYKWLTSSLAEQPAVAAASADVLRSAANVFDAAYRFLYQRTLANAQAVAVAYESAQADLQSSRIKDAQTVSSLHSIVKKAVSIQELFLHQLQDVHHGPA